MKKSNKKEDHSEELKKLRSYLQSDENEDAKRPLLYPLFQKIFKDKFKIESSACGADVYVEGNLLVEAKTDSKQWSEAFYQALHYTRRYGLAYHTILVIAHQFVGIWKLNKIPEFAVILSKTCNPSYAPNAVGRENAKKTSSIELKNIKEAAQYWLDSKKIEGDIFTSGSKLFYESFEILKILTNLDSDRQQINRNNFINTIDRMKMYFTRPIDAIHAFYTIVAYWDINSTLAINEETSKVSVVGFNGSRISESVEIIPKYYKEFKQFVENQYIFTNEGSGFTVDYYFSRFDEVLAVVDPEYVKQHGIFFTDPNLSKFALWYVENHFPGNIKEDYIVFDPAGGSGNLISSWHGKLKHKIISELQPDLLKTIERRMKVDPFHIETGFTIIPKTTAQKGLNFIDSPASIYFEDIAKELKIKNINFDKPLAFLLNPPYKNTDENEKLREETSSEYVIHSSILEITGEDAGKERYLAFLGQILNLSQHQSSIYPKVKPIVMIFTPTSWLIPRPSYQKFREIWDNSFEYQGGFIVSANEFFKVEGKWPLAFTLWEYSSEKKQRTNQIVVDDLTHFTRKHLNIIWTESKPEINFQLETIFTNIKPIKLDNTRGDIRNLIPKIEKVSKDNEVLFIKQTRYDFSYAKKDKDFGKLVSGFPLLDKERHFVLKRICGDLRGTYIGFMDDNTPIRLRQDTCERMSNKPDRVWFMLMSSFSKINVSQIHSGAANSRSYCAYDLTSAKALSTWFAVSKAVIGKYPLWANQYEMWSPNIPKHIENQWYALCFAYILAENRCVVTKFEANNPVENIPEVFVDNPLCPTLKESFWSTTLDSFVTKEQTTAYLLIESVKKLYQYWNKNYCKGQFLFSVGLHEEPYFKYFNYQDFLTPYSGLVQIRKYAENENLTDILALYDEIAENTKIVKAEMYNLLVNEMAYFA